MYIEIPPPILNLQATILDLYHPYIASHFEWLHALEVILLSSPVIFFLHPFTGIEFTIRQTLALEDI